MKIRTGLVLILLVLTLSLTTTAAVTQQNNPVLSWTLTQTVTQHQSTLKGMTIKWGTETLAPTNTTDNEWFPSVCCFPDGSGFIIAWASDHTGDRDIYIKLFNETGHNQTDDIPVNGNTAGSQWAPSVCCFPDSSGFVVAWTGDQTGDDDVYAKVFKSTTRENITDDILVNIYTDDDQMYPDVGCFPGGFVVAWQSWGQDGDYEGVYAQIFNATTGDNMAANDIQVNSYASSHQWEASVCCFSDGWFVVAWESYGSFGQDDQATCILVKLFNETGHNQTDDIQVNTYWLNSQMEPSVCCFPDDSGFAVAWRGKGQGWIDGVYAQIFNETGHNQTANDIPVKTYTTGIEEKPSVCCFPDGSGFVVTWQYWLEDDGGQDIYAKAFDLSGKSKTGVTRVNTYTTDDQWQSSVCCLVNNSFVVTWASDGQDTSSWGVYFRIGHLTPGVSPLLLGVLFIAQSGAGVSMPLLVGGILVVAVVAGVLVFWWFRRGR